MSGPRHSGFGFLIASAAVIVAVGLGACGDSSDSGTTSAEGAYVTAKSLNRYEPGTPQRTVLQWWKAVQFADPTVAHGFYAPQRAPRLPELQHRLAIASNQFAGIPDFHSMDVRGNRATVYFFSARPGSSAPPRAVSVNLVRTGKSWALADDQLLSQVVERVESASVASSS